MTGMLCSVAEAAIVTGICGVAYYLSIQKTIGTEVVDCVPVTDVFYTVLVWLALICASFANAGCTAMRRGLDFTHTPGSADLHLSSPAADEPAK